MNVIGTISAPQAESSAAVVASAAPESKNNPAPVLHSTPHPRLWDQGLSATEVLRAQSKQVRVGKTQVHVSTRTLSKSPSVVNFIAFLKDREKILQSKLERPIIEQALLPFGYSLSGGFVGLVGGFLVGSMAEAMGSLLSDHIATANGYAALGVSVLLAPIAAARGIYVGYSEAKRGFRARNFKDAVQKSLVVPVLDLGDAKQLCITPFGLCSGKAASNGDFYLDHLNNEDIKNFTLAELNAAIEKKAAELLSPEQNSVAG